MKNINEKTIDREANKKIEKKKDENKDQAPNTEELNEAVGGDQIGDYNTYAER